MAKDITKALIDLLKADSAVAALVSTRVFGEEIPQSEMTSMPRQCIVVRRIPGTTFQPRSVIELEGGSIDIISYGGSPIDAQTVRRAAYTALKFSERKIFAESLVHSIEPISSPESLRDVDARWPAVRETWQFIASETTAS